MDRYSQIENIATLAICGATLVGLYAFGAGAHSFWALIMLLNLNYPRHTETDEQ